MRLKNVLFIAALASACAASSVQNVPMPDLAVDAAEGRARIVVLRDDGNVGRERPIIVFDGDREIGRLGTNHHLAWERSPGKHLLRVEFDRPRAVGENLFTFIDHVGAGGETAYLSVSLDMAPDVEAFRSDPGKPILTWLDPAEGARRLTDSTAAGTAD